MTQAAVEKCRFCSAV